MENKYSNRYFKKQSQVNDVWREFMSKEDVFNQIKSIKGSIAYMSRHSPHKLAKEDMEFMEEPLAKLEIAIRKIKNIPECFNLTENELQTVHEEYKKLRQEIEKIDLQRISWN